MPNPAVVSESRVIPVIPDEAFARTLPMPLPELFVKWYGPFPPIKAVKHHGSWGEVGQSRTIVLAGPGKLRETLTTVDGPKVFGYRIDKITGALAPLVHHIDGEWQFEPVGTGTRVTWQWALHPRFGVAAPIVNVLAKVWRGYARQSLEQLATYLMRQRLTEGA